MPEEFRAKLIYQDSQQEAFARIFEPNPSLSVSD
jgi:hypothetical protein